MIAFLKLIYSESNINDRLEITRFSRSYHSDLHNLEEERRNSINYFNFKLERRCNSFFWLKHVLDISIQCKICLLYLRSVFLDTDKRILITNAIQLLVPLTPGHILSTAAFFLSLQVKAIIIIICCFIYSVFGNVL